MAKIDETYHKLADKILAKGFKYEDPNRKGVYRLQIPRYTIEHDFSDGFPAISTKALYWKGIVGELLWILRGDTNIKYLADNGINIWNKDAYNYYLNKIGKNNKGEYYLKPMELNTFLKRIKDNNNYEKSRIECSNYKLGDLGRVYGYQLRNFNGSFDQLKWIIDTMKNNPLATKKTVSFINPADKPYQALTPCHTGFKILVEEISKGEYGFRLQWEQDSVDVFLGLPFNIASYALLAYILQELTGMKALGIIGDLSNVHIYEPHVEAVKTQLSRSTTKHKKCEVDYHNLKNYIDLKLDLDYMLRMLKISDFKLRGYESYPKIPAEMLAYNK